MVHEYIKISERAQLKTKMKVLGSKKRGTIEAELRVETLDEPISKTTNDIKECADTGMFDFGKEISLNIYAGRERDIGNEDFLNGARLNRKNEFDNAIKLWMRHVPDWEVLFPKELGDNSSIAVTDLYIVNL